MLSEGGKGIQIPQLELQEKKKHRPPKDVSIYISRNVGTGNAQLSGEMKSISSSTNISTFRSNKEKKNKKVSFAPSKELRQIYEYVEKKNETKKDKKRCSCHCQVF